jgi:hypothetical protein
LNLHGKARKEKSERTKSLGSPIQLPGKALSMHVRDGDAWIAENTTITRRIDLEVHLTFKRRILKCYRLLSYQTGNTLQIYRGHTGPVSALAFCDRVHGSGDGKILITGSWDQVCLFS